MAFTYDLPENHVEKRGAISPVLRSRLFDIPRETWRGDPRLRGEPEFWLQIHEGLLEAAAQLPLWAGDLLEETEETRLRQFAPRVAGLGAQLAHHAHGHHHIEDHHFFPVFLRAFPQLEHPLALLDGDHKVLAEVLHGIETAVQQMVLAIQQGSGRDGLLKASEAMLEAGGRLDRLFRRHIADEEEICIPAMFEM